MIRRILHGLLIGHQWQLVGQTACGTHSNLATWASQFTPDDRMLIFITRATWGWTTCLLVCPCSAVKTVEMVGQAKDVKK